MSKQNKLIQLLMLFCLIGGVGNALTYGQTTKAADNSAENDSPTVKALLDEVRQLRLVMQRNSVATYRAQVTLERLKLQQMVVNDLLKEQSVLRQRLKESERNLLNHSEMAAQREKLVNTLANPAERLDREEDLRELKVLVEGHKQEIQDLRERESQLVARLQNEQAKLNELNDSLDKLERELENAASDKGKRP